MFRSCIRVTCRSSAVSYLTSDHGILRGDRTAEKSIAWIEARTDWVTVRFHLYRSSLRPMPPLLTLSSLDGGTYWDIILRSRGVMLLGQAG
jgi:hypothetical protein